jgi:hypothetical protein
MRHLMPECAAFLDSLREEFGRADVDGWVRAGLANGTFYAEEGGHTVGRPQPREGYVRAFVAPAVAKEKSR